jgi:UDP-N-acetylglucosamine--N-acetylmuramyl-(pentapeptide) pyrophosphoryl-undecaprenol N-acetylglucosamine transferase
MISVAFTGGGTGGHIYPGLAVAAELKKLTAGFAVRLFWIGSSKGMDRGIVEKEGIEFFGIPSGKLRRYFSFATVTDLFKVAAGFFAARKILKKQKVCLLFSKGGFVSVPPCAAAASLKIKVFTHESDFSPGLATRINIRYVLRTSGKIFAAYDDTVRLFPKAVQDRVTVSGNPVRGVFFSADEKKGRAFLNAADDARILLVLGGSQGAKEINDLILAALPELTKLYTVVHQTGPNLEWNVSANESYKPFPYISEELPHVMAAAELITGRSGAGIWEWAVVGKPMLLIPLSGSGTRGDQVENAKWFVKTGAAQILSDSGVSSGVLADAVNSLAHDVKKRQAMAAASLKTGKKNCALIIAQAIADEITHYGGNS